MSDFPDTPLFDRKRAIGGYKLNKMAMSLGKAENREAFKADPDGYMDRFGLSKVEKSAVKAADWREMVRLGGNLFFILKLAAIYPRIMTEIGAAQASMTHEDFLTQRLGKR